MVTVTIHAQNDAATITGDTTGNVTEAGGVNNGTPGMPTATGNLDADRRRQHRTTPGRRWRPAPRPPTATAPIALTAAGVWTYTLDDDNAAVQALNGAGTLTDTFTALTADGTAQLVTVTIHAQNDAATVAGGLGNTFEVGELGVGSSSTAPWSAS